MQSWWPASHASVSCFRNIVIVCKEVNRWDCNTRGDRAATEARPNIALPIDLGGSIVLRRHGPLYPTHTPVLDDRPGTQRPVQSPHHLRDRLRARRRTFPTIAGLRQ